MPFFATKSQMWAEGLQLWYAELIKAQATPENGYKFTVSDKSIVAGAGRIFAYIKANVNVDAAAVARGQVGTVDATSKAIVAMGKVAFLEQAPAAISSWKDQSGSTHARNKCKKDVVDELKRKVTE